MPVPTKEEILEQLRTTNDDYHEIINNIMENEDTPVGVKASIGAIAKGIFELMEKVSEIFRHSVED